MTNKQEIGQRLRFARERKGLQQKYVAKKLGIHNTTLSKMELGFHEPDSEKLVIFSELYGVKPEWILFGDEKFVDNELTEQEVKVLALFNSLSDEGRKWLLDTIQMLRKK